jgi:murein DD-endopeptidase MepM/ murein hydrolase activator NlpD
VTVRVFPLPLDAPFDMADTYGAPRPGGRAHEGTDIFAPEGTPVLAVDVGRVEFHPLEGIGGNVAYLHTDDRTRYVYSHLQDFQGEPRRVVAGDVIGRVGNTGNASDTRPHLHFEIHPLEGAPSINPYAALKAAVAAASPAPATSSSSSSPALEGLALVLLVWLFSQRQQRWRLN